MDLASLQQLIKQAIMERSSVERIEHGRTIRIDATATGTAPPPEPSAAAGRAATNIANAIVAPCFGIVHLSPSPGAPAFVTPGDNVVAGQKVCLVEAMKVFSAVISPIDGRLTEILVMSGEEVARGQALFCLEPVEG